MKLADLNVLPEHERLRLLALGAGRVLDFPADATIAEVFRERAMESPDIAAVVFGDTSLTYRELDEWSDRLAGRLSAVHQIGPDQVVALCFHRGIEMIVAIIAVWKAGAAYVPIDPAAPQERVRYMLSDTAAPVVLCDAEQQDRMRQLGNAVVVPVDDTQRSSLQDAAATVFSVNDTHAGNLAYVIYTSGTTGRPKGVMIENRSVINHVAVISDLYGFADKPGSEVMLQALNYSFDGGVVPMVLALLTGNTLLLAPDRPEQRGDELTGHLRDKGVTHINGTPTFYQHIELGEVPSLKRMVVGGETLNAACLREMTRANKVPVYNEYGPTEATISTTSHAVREHDLAIGRPQSNSFVLVLDQALRLAPIGAVGEIFLGGPGLARGYLNLPEKTAERFVRNPFQTDEEKTEVSFGPDGRNARLYRTGDLARLRSDGALEYVGRSDTQVKIRGFRVELTEIESTLAELPGVTQSVVLTETRTLRDGANSTASLTGYYVADASLCEEEVRGHLEMRLPSYMVPNEIVHVTALPTTVNGKIDAEALRALRRDADDSRLAPRTELEGKLQQIIATVIGVEVDRIGVQDDLFQLGLNSILVVKLVAELRNELGADVVVPTLFLYPSIVELAESPELQKALVTR